MKVIKWDSGRGNYYCVFDETIKIFNRLGYTVGLFAQMIIATDINNIGEIWNGPMTTDQNPSNDEIECLYPKGYKHLMMLYPDHVKRLPGFNFDYWNLPNDVLREECEQYTLRTFISNS